MKISKKQLEQLTLKRSMSWDVFISHASEDKEEVARPLYKLLTEAGLTVWLDEIELTIGDSLARKIDEGLLRSNYGIVILSPQFLAKGWTKFELDGLILREVEGHKVILPVWHNLTKEEVLNFSPILASKLAGNTNDGLDKVTLALLKAIRPLVPAPAKDSIINKKENSNNQFIDLLSKYRLVIISIVAAFIIVFSLYKLNNKTYKQDSNPTVIAENEVFMPNPIQTKNKDTGIQYDRYRSMIKRINELIPSSTKGYDVFTNIIWSHHDCDTVKQAVRINRVIGSSLKLLVADIYKDDALVQESNFNISSYKSLIREIDQWDEDYNKLINKNKSPCKMPMFAPMSFLMLRGDLIELKDDLNQRLGKK